MFSHVFVGSNDLEKSKHFYDAIFGALGYRSGVSVGDERYVYSNDKGFFAITRPIDGQPATSANGSTIGFYAKTQEAVDNWHAAGVENGGMSIEEPPGVRDTPFGAIYLAYLRDPDGNKLCAMYRVQA
ncbi:MULTISPECIES: VOC family protein [Photobacterium]|uniref:Glyoxalase n=1 Tax=Photobacterium ganghwense TaxID=320778 RepID=A0A0J1HFE3_9GAMM|nr:MULTISPECIES: VOC family protein [Photobacterium]KLV10331.1 glyoxalase [Photobacterium ganghwense]PSU09777.1 VOC family protein [Photobacterium ganghwense]QSV17024.1 VOC family protein [Photobacterium ganghwense]